MGAIPLMQETYIINLPLSIRTHKRDKNNKFYLNLNIYRNAHFHTLNKAKELFTELVLPTLKHIPPIKKLDISYCLFTGSKTLVDVANICCIVDKFFCDTLTESGVLLDDNLEIISNISYSFGSIDRDNPRVEATLHNIEFYEEEKDMRIILVQDEIELAVTNYVRSQINIQDNQDIKIELKAGRGEAGYTADIDIVAKDQTKSGPQTTEKLTESVSEPKTNEDQSGLKKLFDEAGEQKETGDGTAININNDTQEDKPDPVEEKTQLIQKETAATEAPTSVAEPKSLFANLGKPVNK